MLEIAASEYLASHQESIESIHVNTLVGYDKDALTLPQTDKKKGIPKPHAMAPSPRAPTKNPRTARAVKKSLGRILSDSILHQGSTQRSPVGTLAGSLFKEPLYEP